jgi:hypothetical protein
MKNNKQIKCFILLGIVFLAGLWLTACASPASETDASPLIKQAEPTQDLCSAANKEVETRRLHRYMVIFDDLSVLAQATPREQLAVVILEMQKVRRDAAFEEVQPCFGALQSTQVSFMNAVINTMTSFLSGIQADILEKKIAETRQLRSSYDVELANNLGLTYVTATPAPSVQPPSDTPTFTPAPVSALGIQDSYILDGPGSQFMAVDTFLTGQEANIVARSADNQWLKISRVQPSTVTGWIGAQYATINGDINQVPVE